MVNIQSEMLRLFLEGTPSYEPTSFGAGLSADTGQPSDALAQHRLLGRGLVIQDIWVRPTGALIVFATGEQYYAPGHSDELAQIAAKAGFGPEEQLLDFYRKLPKTYSDKLPSVEPPTPGGEKPTVISRLEALQAAPNSPASRPQPQRLRVLRV